MRWRTGYSETLVAISKTTQAPRKSDSIRMIDTLHHQYKLLLFVPLLQKLKKKSVLIYPWFREKENPNFVSDNAQLYTVLCTFMELKNPHLSVFITVIVIRKYKKLC